MGNLEWVIREFYLSKQTSIKLKSEESTQNGVTYDLEEFRERTKDKGDKSKYAGKVLDNYFNDKV